MMDVLVAEISDLFQIDEDASRILLRYCKWHKEVVIDKYYADNSKLMVDAGVRPEAPCSEEESKSAGSEIMCRICCDNFQATEMFGLSCGHTFCR